ncbi:Cenpk [Columba guinea]|nr:Cenpk [Columba guinea]
MAEFIQDIISGPVSPVDAKEELLDECERIWKLLEELQKVENGLEMMLSTVESKNRQLEEDLKREQQWLEEQEQVLDALNGIEQEIKAQVEEISRKSSKKELLRELQNKMLQLKTFKNDLLNTLHKFLEEHFPLPKKDGIAANKNSSEQPAELITLNEVIEILVSKLMDTPHEPYVTINDSFWVPYIELLLRYGIVLRHPEDPKRIRLEAFHM